MPFLYSLRRHHHRQHRRSREDQKIVRGSRSIPETSFLSFYLFFFFFFWRGGGHAKFATLDNVSTMSLNSYQRPSFLKAWDFYWDRCLLFVDENRERGRECPRWKVTPRNGASDIGPSFWADDLSVKPRCWWAGYLVARRPRLERRYITSMFICYGSNEMVLFFICLEFFCFCMYTK